MIILVCKRDNIAVLNSIIIFCVKNVERQLDSFNVGDVIFIQIGGKKGHTVDRMLSVYKKKIIRKYFPLQRRETMKVSEVMTKNVVRISPDESVNVAARMLTHYNIGALPVCTAGGKLCGMVTDRDLVVRCVAANRPTAQTQVRQVMTNSVLSVEPTAEIADAARLMGTQQVRRLPVVENGKVCGMVSIGDLTANRVLPEETFGALTDITSNIRKG